MFGASTGGPGPSSFPPGSLFGGPSPGPVTSSSFGSSPFGGGTASAPTSALGMGGTPPTTTTMFGADVTGIGNKDVVTKKRRSLLDKIRELFVLRRSAANDPIKLAAINKLLSEWGALIPATKDNDADITYLELPVELELRVFHTMIMEQCGGGATGTGTGTSSSNSAHV